MHDTVIWGGHASVEPVNSSFRGNPYLITRLYSFKYKVTCVVHVSRASISRYIILLFCLLYAAVLLALCCCSACFMLLFCLFYAVLLALCCCSACFMLLFCLLYTAVLLALDISATVLLTLCFCSACFVFLVCLFCVSVLLAFMLDEAGWILNMPPLEIEATVQSNASLPPPSPQYNHDCTLSWWPCINSAKQCKPPSSFAQNNHDLTL